MARCSRRSACCCPTGGCSRRQHTAASRSSAILNAFSGHITVTCTIRPIAGRPRLRGRNGGEGGRLWTGVGSYNKGDDVAPVWQSPSNAQAATIRAQRAERFTMPIDRTFFGGQTPHCRQPPPLGRTMFRSPHAASFMRSASGRRHRALLHEIKLARF